MTSTGGITTSGSGNFAFGGGTVSIAGTLQEGNSIPSRTAVISVLPGTTLNVGSYQVSYFSSLTVDGTMNAGAIYTANGTAGQTFLNGNGVINTATFVTSGGGTARFSNGVLNVSGSFAVAPAVPAIGAAVAGAFEQDSGTVNVTGTGDGFTLGYSSNGNGNGAYTQYGGVLNVPNEYVELCYESGAGGNSYFQVLGNQTTSATANVYGISLGQTVNNGVQDGNGTVKLGDYRSRLVIGAGGIVAAGTGTQIFDLASGTLASSAPWSTTVPLTLNGVGNAPTNIDASAGTISLDGPIGGAGGIREIGSGMLVLGGTNTYTGGTIVEDGTLVLDSPSALASGSSLTVGQDASSIFAPAAGPAIAALPAGVATVPEPGSLMLLAAGMVVGFGVRLRKRHIRRDFA
jgi:autotransporter-associated beta strand protein